MSFSELSWVLQTRDKTLIFGATINLVFRLKLYLNLLLCDEPDRDIRIRIVHGLNWDSDNEASIQAMKTDPRCQILISTYMLAPEVHVATIKFVLLIREPDTEMYAQKPGWAGRDPSVAADPCPSTSLSFACSHNTLAGVALVQPSVTVADANPALFMLQRLN
ncbi:hypothetical protein CPB85DRAFT_1442337 [Mucidula mucida]|nr:hypothetical protein CPB85DRAFT_1442337 [Mucidula mucida]